MSETSSNPVVVTLPDGKTREFPAPVTGAQLAIDGGGSLGLAD